eukprot:g7563.t1
MELGTRHRHLMLSTRPGTGAVSTVAAGEGENGTDQALLGGGGSGGGGGDAGSTGAAGPRDDDAAEGPSLGSGGGGGSNRVRSKSSSAAAFGVKGAKGPFARWLDLLSPSLKFAVLVACVMISFCLHNMLQESLFAMEGFNFGWSLGLLEAVGVLAGSMLERAHSADARKRVAPFKSYVVLAGILGMSSSLSNMALNYIKYPTKVIFRSCKLIPTMVIAVVWRKKIVSRWEFLAAFAVCAGLIIFAGADRQLEPDFDFRGIIMVMLSVCADAFLPNMQEHVFSMGASRVEVTFFTNSLTVLGMLVSTAANGNLAKFLRYAVTSRTAMSHMLVYCIMSHVAIAAHMMVLKEYGGVTAVLVGNTRKSMTIALSFFLFPKPFSYNFVLGGALVLGGLAANVMIKERRKARKAPPAAGSLGGGREDASPNGAADLESGGGGEKDGGGGGGSSGSSIGVGADGGGGGKSHRNSWSRPGPLSTSSFPPSAAVVPGRVALKQSKDSRKDRVNHQKRQEKQQHQQQQQQQQQQRIGSAPGSGPAKAGLLQSWRPRLGRGFSNWRGPAAEDPTAGDGRGGKSIAFAARVEGEAMEPLLVSKGRGADSSDQ